MKESSFFNFFPTPSYLKVPVYAFDISDQSIKYILFFRKNNKIYLKKFGKKIIPKGIIESGGIKKESALAEFLANFRNEIGGNYASVILPEEKAYLANIKLPMMKKSEVRDSLELQIEEHIPLKVQEVVFDYDLTQDEKHLDVNLIAFSKKVISSYRNVFTAAGFNIMAFEMEAHALSRALIDEKSQDVNMMVDFGRTHTSFIIVDSGRVKFSFTVGISGQQLDDNIIKSLSIDSTQVGKIKKGTGLSLLEENKDIFSAILPVMHKIESEANRLISFWNSHNEEHGKRRKKIKNIIFSGGEANLKGLSEYLTGKLGIEVVLANPWINILSTDDRIPEIEFEDSLMYAASLGLGLRFI